MIGDFFTKPLGGAKFRRFRNIILNCNFDEHGPVDVDALMATHFKKMERRISHHGDEARDESTFCKESVNVDSQECVGNRSNNE